MHSILVRFAQLRNFYPIIPILFRQCIIPPFLRDKQYIDFVVSNKYHAKFSELLAAIQGGAWRNLPIRNFAVHKDKKFIQCVTETTSFADAHMIIQDANFRLRHLLVTETGNVGSKLLGIVGLRQFEKVIARRDVDTNKMTVADIMIAYSTDAHPYPTFVRLHEDDTLEMALKAFTTMVAKAAAAIHFFYMSAIPLVDSKENAVGIVSFKDILNGMMNGDIPIPQGTVGDYMQNPSQIAVGLPGETAPEVKIRMLLTGKRDTPVVNNKTEWKLLGLVPDHLFIMHTHNGKKMGEILIPLSHLKLQTTDVSLATMLAEYVPSAIAKVYFSFVVVDSKNLSRSPHLLGMIGYRDIFEALLKQ